MKKQTDLRIQRLPLKRIFFFLLLLYIGALIIPYVPHKKVSDSYKENFAGRSFYNNGKGTERTAYIDDNMEALKYRLRMIEEAEEEIILSTFDFHADQAGKDILSSLQNAADKGVSVKIIVDGISGLMDMKWNPWFHALASHENVKIKIYNPVHLLKPWKIQARLHDKYLIIDEKMYLLGGRNTTNLFLGNYSSSKNIDRELFVYETEFSGKTSIHQLLDYFSHVWNHPASQDFSCCSSWKKAEEKSAALKIHYEQLKNTYPECYQDWNWESCTMHTNRISLLCNPICPSNKEPWMWYSLHQLMMQGEQITLYTPYIICGKEMYEDLSTLKEKGIRLEIITNDVSSGANPWGCTDYLNQKENIWETGAKVYEFMGKHSSHTKAVLIDSRMSIVGSYNLDMRSTYQDTELMLAVDSPELNSIIREEAEKDKTCSRTMEENGSYFYGENYIPREISLGKHIFYAVLRILTIPLRRFL